MLKPLPIGIQTFRKIIDRNYLYVDKTRYIYDMIKTGEVYFLSRPRRFGKSLTISTLEEIFYGNRELFKGLWIYDSDFEWKEHPVIRIDFSRLPIGSPEELKEVLIVYVNDVAKRYKVNLESSNYIHRFKELVEGLGERAKVVILIDEYDKPLLDNIEDLEKAREIQELLKGFYGTIKSLDEYLRFVFITGISKFSRTGIFSAMNNLKGVTMSGAYAAFLGYTEDEIDSNFGDYMAEAAKELSMDFDEFRDKMLEWYNGYRFSEEEKYVCNPFTMLRLLDEKRFKNYWFESGTPGFLIKLIREQRFDVSGLENLDVGEHVFSTYEIDRLNVTAILFQTGYLTIKGYDEKRNRYRLNYPNKEVRESFLEVILGSFSSCSAEFVHPTIWDMIDSLEAQDYDKFFEYLRAFFGDIPYDMYLPQEKYFQMIFYLIFKLMGTKISAEVETSRGRVDVVVEFSDKLYIIEFKFEGRAEEALKQIESRRYYEKYMGMGKEMVLMGVNFSLKEKEFVEYKIRSMG